jgi:hypothetical protein
MAVPESMRQCTEVTAINCDTRHTLQVWGPEHISPHPDALPDLDICMILFHVECRLKAWAIRRAFCALL